MRTIFPRRRLDDRGFSMIEVVVAMVLFGLLAATVLTLFLRVQAATVNNRGRVAASNLAMREIAILREEFSSSKEVAREIIDAYSVVNPHPLDPGRAGETLILDGMEYTVVRSVEVNAVGIKEYMTNCLEQSDVNPGVSYHAVVTVTWPGMGNVAPVRSETSILPPAGFRHLDGTKTFAIVEVVDTAGQPVAKQQVSFAPKDGGASISRVTDARGCARAEVAVAPYDPETWTWGGGIQYVATVTGVGGYVSEESTPSTTVDLGAADGPYSPVARRVVFEKGATLEVTVLGAADSDVAGKDVSIYRTNSASDGHILMRQLAGAQTTITGIFPGEFRVFGGTNMPESSVALPVGPGELVRFDIDLSEFDTDVSGGTP